VAKDLLKLKVIDGFVPEPVGGAHAKPEEALDSLKKAVLKHLGQLEKLSAEQLIQGRYEKFRQMGVFAESV